MNGWIEVSWNGENNGYPCAWTVWAKAIKIENGFTVFETAKGTIKVRNEEVIKTEFVK